MKFILFAVLAAMLLTLAAGYVVLPLLKKFKVGQTISESVNGVHSGKQGTPTMGGVIFLGVGFVVSVLFSFAKSYEGHLYLYSICCMLAFALIGGADDGLKVLLRRNEGLTPKQKMIPQVAFALLFAVLAYFNPYIPTSLRIPFFSSKSIELGVFYIPFIAFVIVAVDNSVNLLDGLDGLCSGSSAIEFAFFGVAALLLGSSFKNVAMLAFVMCACMVAFHRFNAHPARVFMGDIGSLGLGGALSALAIVTDTVLFIPLVMLTAVISTVSDIAQVWYMRRHMGRKLLRMSPLHHHYEMSGVPEERIVVAYNLITVIMCIIALIALV